jgi:hypothetical protein
LDPFEGGGVYFSNTDAVLRNNIIEDNISCSGVGVTAVGGSPGIEGNIIRNNDRSGCSGGNGGGGVMLRTTGEAFVSGNAIEYKSISGGSGGGVSMNAAGSPRFENNIIRYNYSAWS